ncbi:hypothetical protein EGH25_05280 [Haladaptatus sp. F3-133]|jgi:hypothetical protein|uniref:Uncharacterized protein n=1 Tax=Halorutilus salinus TaxID=2487751 RepID=A0A9Q4C467_9EURY|nr:hypothetical protein [Halorutilus salinus]MCX2818762.1 hypothetical protein [Halorutilus salinus]
MTDPENPTCASCGRSVPEDSLECPECGNYPAFEIRKLGAAVVFAGSLLTQLYLYFGLVIIIIGLLVVSTSVFAPVKPTDYEYEFEFIGG